MRERENERERKRKRKKEIERKKIEKKCYFGVMSGVVWGCWGDVRGCLGLLG